MIHPMATTKFEDILPTLQENSKTVRNTYISFLTLTTFIWISIESVTHRMLLIPDENLTLPLIQVKIPIVGFFWAAPFLLILFQLYFQVHVFRFAKDLAKVRDDAKNVDGDDSKGKEKAIANDSITEIPSDWKSQLQGNLFTWNFIDQKSRYEIHGALTSFIVSLSFYWYGVLVLLRVQWVFLPHHHSAMTTTHFCIVLFSLAISFYFGIKAWRLREGDERKLRESIMWCLFYFPGYVLAGLGVYFILAMTWSVLEIPFTVKENERPFDDLSWPVETWLVCFSEGVDEANNEQKNISVNNRGRNTQIAKDNDVSPAELRKANPCKYLKQMVWFLLAPLNTNHIEYKEWSHFKISEVVVRNLNLAEAKLAIGPSEVIKAALIVKEGGNLTEEEKEQRLLSMYDSLKLKGRHLEFANFYKSDLRKVDLRVAQIIGADLREALLQSADLREAIFTGADLRKAQLQGALWYRNQLQGANLYEAELQGVDFEGAQLQGAELMYAQLKGANLRKAQLKGANLVWAKLQGADISGAQLQGGDLNQANLMGVDFGGAQLQGADLYGTNLRGADFKYAELQGANFNGARLQAADFSGARLQAADFSGAQLEGANLYGTNLQGAMFHSTKVGKLKFQKGEPEIWAEELPEKERNQFIKKLDGKAGEMAKFSHLVKPNGDPLLAHNIQSWGENIEGKKKKTHIPTLFDFEQYVELQKEWNDFDGFGMENKEISQAKKNKRMQKRIEIFSTLFKEQRKTWDRLLCDFPILQNKRLKGEEKNPLTQSVTVLAFPHAPYFSKEKVQAAINKCEKLN